MKHFFLFAILTCLTCLSFGQSNDDNSFFTNSYNRNVIKENKIDTINVTIHFPEKQSQRLFSFDTLGNLTHTVTYDESGNKTSESFLSYKVGRLVSRKDKEEMIDDNTIFFYNQKGQLNKAVTVNKEKDTIITTYVYENKKLIEETRKERTSKLVSRYKYDSKNRLIDFTTLSFPDNRKKGTVAVHKSIFYDDKGNKSMEKVTLFMEDTVIYKYDDSKRLIAIQKGEDSEKYFYDESGHLSKKEVVRMLIGSPLIYVELYTYSVRQ